MQTTPLAQQAIALLIRRLADPVEEVADAASQALLAFGPHALEQVAAACADSDTDRAVRALRWLGESWETSLGEPAALAAVIGGLAADDGAVRAQAAATLGVLLWRWGLTAEADRRAGMVEELTRCTALLCQACRDADPQVRAAAAEALGQVPDGGKADLPEMFAALQDALGDNTSRAVREAAARSLGQLAERCTAD